MRYGRWKRQISELVYLGDDGLVRQGNELMSVVVAKLKRAVPEVRVDFEPATNNGWSRAAHVVYALPGEAPGGFAVEYGGRKGFLTSLSVSADGDMPVEYPAMAGDVVGRLVRDMAEAIRRVRA